MKGREEEGWKEGRKKIKSQKTHIIEKISIKLMKVINGVGPLFKSPKSAIKLGAGWVTLTGQKKIKADLSRKSTWIKNALKSWKGGSAINCTCCSCGRPEFSSQHPHEGCQASVTPACGDRMPSSHFHRYCIYVADIHTCKKELFESQRMVIDSWRNWIKLTVFLYCWN